MSTHIFHRLNLLIALYLFCIVVSELMGAKTFPLLSLGHLHLTASVAIFVIPPMFSLLDIVNEVYGPPCARHLALTGLLVIALLMGFAALATHLPPSSRFQASNAAYNQVFGSSVRLAAASLTAFAVSNLLDILIFARLRRTLHRHALWLRNNVSNFASQLTDSVVFITLAFYQFNHSPSVNFPVLLGLILPYWLLKCGCSIIETPFVYVGVRWARQDVK